MSNAPITPEPVVVPQPDDPTAVEYESLPPTGVRKVLGSFEERWAQRHRWGAVVAGLFLAIGTQIVLGLLGVAIGLSRVNPASTAPPSGLGTAGSLWVAISGIIALFIGGYTAAKLSGAIRRGDGMISGLLTWATTLVVALWLVGATAGAALSGALANPVYAPTAAHAGAAVLPAPSHGPISSGTPGVTVRANAPDAAKAAWMTFGGVMVGLFAALAGGAVGSAGGPGFYPNEREREEAIRRERELDREARFSEYRRQVSR